MIIAFFIVEIYTNLFPTEKVDEKKPDEAYSILIVLKKKEKMIIPFCRYIHRGGAYYDVRTERA